MKEYPKEYLIEHKVTYQKGYKAFRNEILGQTQEGQPLSEFTSQVKEPDFQKKLPDIPISELKDYGKMKERLRIRLMGRKGIAVFLEEVPYQVHPMGVVTVYAKFEEKKDGIVMGMHITHLIRDVWGISEEVLFETALENSKEKDFVQFHPLEEEFVGVMGMERTKNEAADPNTLYILSNQSKQFGAAVLLYPGVLESVHKRLGGDYYILPSSVHEVLVLSKGSDIPPEVLKSTVKAVNRREIRPEERLANELYEYRGENGTLKRCHIPEKEMTL